MLYTYILYTIYIYIYIIHICIDMCVYICIYMCIILVLFNLIQQVKRETLNDGWLQGVWSLHQSSSFRWSNRVIVLDNLGTITTILTFIYKPCDKMKCFHFSVLRMSYVKKTSFYHYSVLLSRESFLRVTLSALYLDNFLPRAEKLIC